MKVTFYSNFLNHHQLPFCLEMFDKLGEDFKFVATEPIHEERLQMGYEDMSGKYLSFSINSYKSSQDMEMALRLGDESDVVIIGSAPDYFIKNRLDKNKLTFRYSERIFKKGRYRVLNPRTFLSLKKKHTRKKNVYMLCASAYTASDFSLVGAYKENTFKWGYFPDVREYNVEKLISKKNRHVPKILWVGRLLDLKHPETTVIVANMLKKQGYKFQMELIGSGVLEDKLVKLINKYDLSDNVKLLGSMSPEHVREHMEDANIFLFTSDFNEGWGAVLNESMNSACAVVASHAIGSVPFLIEHKKNGFIYKNGDIQDLYNYTKELLDDPYMRDELGREAYKTLKDTWNAKTAVGRFLELANALLEGENNNLFIDGPCSKALDIKQDEMYSYLTEK